jgi:hypothetical protein
MGNSIRSFTVIFLLDSALIEHFNSINQPLPFSRSSLRKDRITGCLGGVPFRRIGGLCYYTPDDVIGWLAGHQIIQPQRHPALAVLSAKKTTGRRGKPSKIESVEAARRGITVPELRAQRQEEGKAV